MSGNPLDKRRDTRTSASSSIAGCGWVEIQHNLCFVDDEGQILPAAGAQYRLQIPHGAAIYGVLDDNGYASHEGIGFGTVLLEVEPHVDDQKQLILKEIKQAMDEFIAVERKESEAIKARMQNKSDLEEDWEYTKAVGRGGRDAAVGVVEAAVDLSINIGKEALHLLGYFNPLTAPNSYQRDVARVKQAKKELQAITDADWQLYATLMNDDETQKLFKQFASDYLDAQHSLEITEGTTEVITVILGVVALKAVAAITTTGAGTSKLAQLGGKLVDPIKRLIDVLKRAQAKKKVKGDGNQRLESRVEIGDNRQTDGLTDAKEKSENKPKETGAGKSKDSSNLAGGGSNNPQETSTIFRVQGGTPPKASRNHIEIDANGNPLINKTTLNVSIGDVEHAKYFQSLRPGSEIVSFEAPKWVDDFIQSEAIPQANYRSNPMNQNGLAPKIVDPTTPGRSYELPSIWTEWLEETAIKGSGKVIK